MIVTPPVYGVSLEKKYSPDIFKTIFPRGEINLDL